MSIRDFVLIDRLDLSPDDGFTALTGETGAGKSIILDALSVALGGPAERRFVREGAEVATVSAAFELDAEHPVWAVLREAGIDADPREALTLRRILRASGPARASVNDQPLSAQLLTDIGRELVEIHGQHAASALFRPSVHRHLLDQFAGNERLLETCAAAWDALVEMRAQVAILRDQSAASDEARQELELACQRLAELAPQIGEAEQLARLRTQLMQAERVSSTLNMATDALAEGDISGILGRAARGLEQVAQLPGYDGEDIAAVEARNASEALERALIEVQEGERALAALNALADASPEALETAEARLFALRAAARKHNTTPDDLPELARVFTEQLSILETGGAQLERVEARAREALARWHTAAQALHDARTSAAKRLGKLVMAELKPLKLDRMAFRTRIDPLPEGEGGGHGSDAIAFEVATNGAKTYQPLAKVASGGEVARLSLALKCALAGSGTACTLIFDEADQGVGGAVAAAIGERLSRLGAGRQVFAITHSPQVAAAAGQQWLIAKTTPRKGLGRTFVSRLDVGQRREEIARMLAGAAVTNEARAAAGRLLEEPWQKENRSAN